jgi:hypothetical protein
MKQKELTNYDPMITAPYIIFKQIDSKNFLVNSLCIFAFKKIITVGKEYIVVDNSRNTGVEIDKVKLVDCNYRNGIIHIILRNIRSQIVSTLNHHIEYPETDCSWLLVDTNYVFEKESIKAIQSYCHCEDNPPLKSNTEILDKSMPDELLEFEL